MFVKITVTAIFTFFCFWSSSETFAQSPNLRAGENFVVKSTQKTAYSFKIEAAKDKIISLEIKQNGMDIAAKLFDSRNSLIAESDSPFSEQETERIFIVSPQDDIYKLEITAKFPDEKGSLNIKFNESNFAAPNDFKRAEAEKLFSQAQKLRATGKNVDRNAAVEIFNRSLTLWREAENRNGELRTLAVLAYLNRILGKFNVSLELANLILQSPKSSENEIYRADALYQIGQINYTNGKLSEAIVLLKESLAQFAEASPFQANTLAALGYYYQFIDEFELAQKAFDDSLENCRRFPDIYNEAQVRHLIGIFDFNSNEFESAAANFKTAADLREKFGNRRGQAVALSFLGMSYQSLKKLPEALEVFEKALAVSREMGDKENQTDTLVSMAVIYREYGNMPKALALYDEAAAIWGNEELPETLYLSRGVAYFENSNFAEARLSFENAIKGFRKAGDIGGEAKVFYNFARLERAENNLEEAKTKIERALEIHEYEQSKYKNLRRLTGFLELRRRYFDLYIDVLMRLDELRPNENFAEKALQVSESARMRTLVVQLREALKNNPQTVDFQIINNLQKVQQQIGEQLALLSKAQTKNENIAPIEKTIADLNKQNEDLKAQLRLSNPSFAALANPPTLSLAEMQSELDDDTVLVEYSLGETRSYLWIVRKNKFEHFVLPKRADIDAQAQNVYQTLSETENQTRSTDKKSISKKDFGTESAKLSQILAIEKFADLPVKRLVFVADGALNSVPFASLTFKNRYLSEKFETVNLPSLSTLEILRQNFNKPFAANSLAIFADPVFSSSDERIAKSKRTKSKTQTLSNELSATLRDFSLTSISRLPFSRIEAEKIAQNDNQNVSLNLGFKANRERILRGDFDNFDILHFATHGFLNNQHPELSGLVLSLVDENGNAQNGFLRTQDLYLLKLRPQMVVLSACQTGIGKQIENEGFAGLTRGFLANGTPRIVSTLWKVDDAASAELMSRFYRAMFKENKKPPAALQTAQNELRQIPRFANPRFWAGFVLTGEWR